MRIPRYSRIEVEKSVGWATYEMYVSTFQGYVQFLVIGIPRASLPYAYRLFLEELRTSRPGWTLTWIGDPHAR